MKTASLHWILASLLVLIAMNSSKKWSYKRKPEWIRQTQDYFIEKGKGTNASRVLATLYTGEKSRLRRKLKREFKLLGLFHLFTPSGLHLSSLYLPFFLLLRSRPSKKLKAFIILFLILPFLLERFYSLKRMCLFHILKIVFPNLKLRTIFILTFGINFFLGGWNDSPLSFGLSFLFLGSLLFSNHPSQAIAMLFFSQLFVSSLFSQYFSPIGFFIGQLFSLLFSTVFPLLVFSTLTFSGADHFIMTLFLDTISLLCEVIKVTPVYFFSPLIVLWLFLMWNSRKSPVFTALIALTLPSQLF